MSAEATDGGEELHEADCGHEVPKDRLVDRREVVICDECYTPFDVTEWPETIEEHKTRVRERRSTSIEISRVYLLGLDHRGRAVYYDQNNRRVRTFVPKHDRAFKQDRQERQQARDQSVLRSKRKYFSPEGPTAPGPGDFVTLPNGDHIVEVETSEKLDRMRGLDEYLSEHTDGWQQVHPKVVSRHNIEGFGAESGKRLHDYECDDCGHVEEDMDPEDAPSRCPECDEFGFWPR